MRLAKQDWDLSLMEGIVAFSFLIIITRKIKNSIVRLLCNYCSSTIENLPSAKE